jgi:uncharacterized protein YegL
MIMKKQTDSNKPTLVAFLLDRSGSMEACAQETRKGFDGYIDTLKKDPSFLTMRFTLTQFDSQEVEIVHNAVELSEVKPLDFKPRGGTPLFDAIGKTIRATEKKAGDKYKVLFVTLTDGDENSSSEWRQDTVNKLIKEMEEKHAWTFAHIGVGISGWNAGNQYLAGAQSFSNNMKSSYAGTGAQYSALVGATNCVARSAGGQSVKHLWQAADEDEKNPS